MARGLVRKDIYKTILQIAHDNPGEATLPFIRRKLGIKPQTLNYYIRRMEKDGLIEVKKTYPRLVIITPKGKRWLLEPTKLQTYSGGQSESPRPTRLHALQVIIPVLKEGDKLPLGKEINMRGWSRRYLQVDIPNTTVEIMDFGEKGKKVRLYIHDIILPPGKDKFDVATQILTKILFIVNAFFTRHKWILDIFHYEVVNQELETAMPELQKGKNGEQPKKVRVHLGRKAKSVDGKEMDEEAWVEIGTDSLKKGIPDRETDDRAHEEKWALLPELVHDVIAPTVEAMGKEVVPLLKSLKEELEMHIDTYRAMYHNQITMNKLLHRMNLILEKLERRLGTWEE